MINYWSHINADAVFEEEVPMLEKVTILIIGIILTLIGLQAFFVRGYRSVMWGRYIDYGPYHSAVGIAFVVVGLIVVYTTAKTIIKEKRKQ
jgi:hypothetical protein